MVGEARRWCHSIRAACTSIAPISALAVAADGLGLALESTLQAHDHLRRGTLVMPFGPLGISAIAHRLLYRREDRTKSGHYRFCRLDNGYTGARTPMGQRNRCCDAARVQSSRRAVYLKRDPWSAGITAGELKVRFWAAPPMSPCGALGLGASEYPFSSRFALSAFRKVPSLHTPRATDAPGTTRQDGAGRLASRPERHWRGARTGHPGPRRLLRHGPQAQPDRLPDSLSARCALSA